MIEISTQLGLKRISLTDQEELYSLMTTIYPPAYAHYWKDDCSWYINTIYSKKNLLNELNDTNSYYYFVKYDSVTIGIFKIITNSFYPPLLTEISLKVHRIYLSPTIQGKGLGSTLMLYAEHVAREKNYPLVWLDAMDTHYKAQSFYKKLGYNKTDVQRLDFPLLLEEHRSMWYMHKMLD